MSVKSLFYGILSVEFLYCAFREINSCILVFSILEKLRSAGNSRRMKSKISSMVEAVEYRNKLIIIAENSAAKWVASERYDHASKIADDSR